MRHSGNGSSGPSSALSSLFVVVEVAAANGVVDDVVADADDNDEDSTDTDLEAGNGAPDVFSLTLLRCVKPVLTQPPVKEREAELGPTSTGNNDGCERSIRFRFRLRLRLRFWFRLWLWVHGIAAAPSFPSSSSSMMADCVCCSRANGWEVTAGAS